MSEEAENLNDDAEAPQEEWNFRASKEELRETMERALEGADSPDPAVRKGSVFGVVSIGLAVRDEVLHALEDDDPEVRKTAAVGAGFLGAYRTIDSLVAHLRGDPSPEVRRSCAMGLCHFDDPRAKEALLKSLSDPHPGVVRTPVLVIGTRRLTAAIPALLDLLDHADAHLRDRILATLEELGADIP